MPGVKLFVCIFGLILIIDVISKFWKLRKCPFNINSHSLYVLELKDALSLLDLKILAL